ncbi:MAG: RNA polymerase sigma factor [Solirubrobacteraceae bacterium]
MPVSTERNAELAALYTRHQSSLRRQVSALVSTTPENVEDACMFAWVQLLRHQLARPDEVGAWLLTVAKREAIKLERHSRRAAPLHGEYPSAVEPADPRDEIATRALTLDAVAAIAAAVLTDRQAKLVGLRAAGLSHDEISNATGDSLRTVERQLLRADRKLRHARTAQGG